VGRPPKKQSGVIDHPSLWSDKELPRSSPKFPEKDFKSLRFPLWTQNKARLIQEYLRLFEFITKHGTYIDGFAAPQESEHEDMWAAKLVLEIEPKWFREFWLCDIDPSGIARLEALKALHETSKRKIEVLSGDFNETVSKILEAGTIGEKSVTFALLDQRTFECEWRTVIALSKHKHNTKIELFYFFPTGWIDRSLGTLKAERTIAKVERWWGRGDWSDLLGMDGTIRAKLVAKRFEDELGYGKATVYPIHSERRRGRVMYHMVHATDHPEASPLMIRAYRKVSGRTEVELPTQADFDEFWRRIESDED
jgi:three-Cys-motif partner protein